MLSSRLVARRIHMFWVAKFDSRRGSWFGFPVPRDIATEYRKSSTKASIQWGKKRLLGRQRSRI